MKNPKAGFLRLLEKYDTAALAWGFASDDCVDIRAEYLAAKTKLIRYVIANLRREAP